MKTIAALLTCHNRKVKTLRSLSALFSQTGIDSEFSLEVFLVDDASSDGTAEAVRRQFPRVKIIAGNGNLFWNRGMHLAWDTAASTAKFDYYLWLNDDTTLTDLAINEMLECSFSSGDMTLICGSTCGEQSGKVTYGGKNKLGQYLIPNNEIQECSIINGNSVLVPNKVFQMIGNLDVMFPHAIGDQDYGLRLLQKGGRCVTTKNFIGFCESNPKLPNWCYQETPILQRLKSLYSPLGYSHPKYFFLYEKRHFGLFTAIKHFCSIHLRVFIPSLWR
ncbi:MAG: glycosyltransferase family 2 protein [Pedobacter sp.]